MYLPILQRRPDAEGSQEKTMPPFQEPSAAAAASAGFALRTVAVLPAVARTCCSPGKRKQAESPAFGADNMQKKRQASAVESSPVSGY